jgi:hypothetical protein
VAAEKVNYRGFKLYEGTTLSINLQAEQRPDMLERARERQEGIAFSSHQTRAACLRWLCWRWLPAQRRLIQCRDRSTRLLHVRSWPIRPLRRRARLSSIRVVTFCTWYRAADKRSVTGSALDLGGRVRLPFTPNRNGRTGTHPPKCYRETRPQRTHDATTERSCPAATENPRGAPALYLWQGNKDTLYRIHGTNEPWTIGQKVSSGCIRMTNDDVTDLYTRTRIGTKVVVLGTAAATASTQ